MPAPVFWCAAGHTYRMRSHFSPLPSPPLLVTYTSGVINPLPSPPPPPSLTQTLPWPESITKESPGWRE